MPSKQTISDLMTRDPVCLDASSTVTEAARSMRDSDIGPVFVTGSDAEHELGIITDRDIVTRVVADGKDPDTVTLRELATWELTSVGPKDPVERAISLMRDHAIRRLPVVEGGKPIGVISLGDLAIERDPESALADISRASPNN
jgi:signal-transduction protein with cAMP-binding, CBS, and nucleotidyltransferase domain